MFRKQYGECWFNSYRITLNPESTFNNPLPGHPVNCKYSFCTNGIFGVFRKVNLLNNFTFEGRNGIFFSFDIIFVKMLLLQRTVEAFDGVIVNGKSKSTFIGINSPFELAWWCFNYLVYMNCYTMNFLMRTSLSYPQFWWWLLWVSCKTLIQIETMNSYHYNQK